MNTNNPDYIKHAKAALASKAEMDKWKKIEIIDAVAALTSLAIAWFASSWIIAIAGIVICGGVGAYASSQKEKAKQDTLDHMNRADGMSESLVGATRSRREAENALAGAISKLDEASSKLRRASTYDEKKKAEAEIVSAQAGIESAKLRLQQATAYEISESQRSQQQTQPDIVKINQPIQEAPSVGFSGEKKLSNDGYKIYLVKKYGIEKNDVLGKFVCSERLFESIDEALTFADSLEDPVSESISIPIAPEMPAVPVIPELIAEMQEIQNAQNTNISPVSSGQKGSKVKLLIGAILLIAIVFGFFKYNSQNNSAPNIKSLDVNELKSMNTRLKNYGQGLDKIYDGKDAWMKQNTAAYLLQSPLAVSDITTEQQNDYRLATPEQKVEILNLIGYRKKEQQMLDENLKINQPLPANTIEIHKLAKQLTEKSIVNAQDLADSQINFGAYNKNRIAIYNQFTKQVEEVNKKFPIN